MTRTTVNLEDEILRQLKERAARERRSLQSLVNALLRRALMEQERQSDYRLELEGWQAVEQPGADILGRDKLFDLMEGR